MNQVALTKPQLAVWLLAALTIPWQLGGKGPVAVLVDVLVAALAVFLLLRSNHIKSVSMSGWLLLPLALLAWGAMSLAWSVNRYQSIVWLEVLALAVVAFLAALSLGRDHKLRQQWLTGYQVIATLSSLWGIIIYLTGSYNRLTSSFYLANPFAAYVLPAALLVVWEFIKTGRRLAMIAAPILVTTLILSDSRSAFLMAALAVLAGAGIRLKTKEWLRLGGVVGAALILTIGLNFARGHIFHHATAVQGARFSEAAKGESTSGSDRVNYLKSTLAIWQHNFTLGTGAGTFGTVHPQFQYRVISATTNAHNFYAQTASELGIFGAAILLVLVGLIGLMIWRSFSTKKDRVLALIVGLMMIHLAIDIDALYPSIMVILAVLVGLLAAGQIREPLKARWSLGVAMVLSLAFLAPAYGAYFSQVQADRALADQNNGDYQVAASEFAAAHTALVFDPDVVSAEGINYYTLAGTETDKSKASADYIQAARLAIQAQKLDPHDAQHVFLQARVLYKQHDMAAAEAAYWRTIKLDSYNHPEYYVDLAYLYLLENNPERVLSTATAILKQYPDTVVANRAVEPDLTFNLSNLYYFRALVEQASDPRASQNDASKALKLNPTNVLAKQLLGGS